MRTRRLAPPVALALGLLLMGAGACNDGRAETSGAPSIVEPPSGPVGPAEDPAPPAAVEDVPMKLTSSAFDHEGPIPARFTCEGDDAFPALSISGVPEGTKSLALIVDDPDAPDPKAPKMTWVHLVLYNLPPTTTALAEDGKDLAKVPKGTGRGYNDWKRTGWGGPCPPIGRHRYYFKLYALDATLELEAPKKADLEQAMKGHVLAEAVLLGTYEKTK